MKYDLRIRSLSNRLACSTQRVSTHGRGLFCRTRQPSERKRKDTSASREPILMPVERVDQSNQPKTIFSEYNTKKPMNEGVVSKETVVLRRWGSVYKNLVLTTELIM